MFHVPTVFILGAGASMPYGFPSGNQLTNIIIKSGLGDLQKECCRRLDISEEQYTIFQKTLRNSATPSIDMFLEKRNADFGMVGKLAIATFLKNYENEDDLLNPEGHESRWYPYFFHRLIEHGDKYPSKNFGIVTFNYDRSLEHFLFTAFSNLYGHSEDDAKNVSSNCMKR